MSHQQMELQYYQTAGHVVAAAITLSAIDAVAVPLKFWVRKKYKQPLRADDWLLIPALIAIVGIAVTVTYGAVNGGLGTALQLPQDFQGDVGAVATDQVAFARQIQWAFVMMYPIALGTVKASFLFLYKRVFTTNKRTQQALTVLIVLVAAWTVAFFFAEMFQCSTKFTANWGSTDVMRAHCKGSVWLLLALCVTDLIFDLTIIILPIPLIWHLKLSTRKKLGITSVFLLGSMTVIASVLRLRFIFPVVLRQAAPLERFMGITTSLYWGTVEAGVAVLVACLPTLQFPVRNGAWRGERSASRKSSAASFASSARLLRMKNVEKPNGDVENQPQRWRSWER